ncbi:TadE family type IV pilus minor pilin [Streptacidiphilus monticola]|uniref:TadE family type IV pilus minor pilin n=1 Tax=Streptacidiphilus monticola TaxID=2161674 RepID=A0ABW1G0D0_9ACTN
MGGDAGYATAELAVVLPALVLLLGVLLWGAVAGAAQLRCVDAAREGARAAARGDPEPAVQAAVRAAAPPGARVVVSWSGDLVRVAVTARSAGPGGFGRALSVGVGATAVARVEPDAEGAVR